MPPGRPAVPVDANSQLPDQMSEGGIRARGIAKAAMQITLLKKVENGRSASPGANARATYKRAACKIENRRR